MRILITGAGGGLGVDVDAAARAAGHPTTPLTRAELDITDPSAVRAAIAEAKPEVVINCAAYTKVDAAEEDEAIALAINSDGAGTLAGEAAAAGAWIVHVSTDYVFDGTKSDEPYFESDPVGPAGAYGRTKLAGERAVAQAAPDTHTIARTAWVFGTHHASCFPKTMLRLAAERDELNVVADQVGCPTYTGHLAPALIEVGTSSRPQGVIHLAGGGRCSWHQFARETIARAGLECEVKPITTAEYPLPAPRPAWSVLASERGRAVPRLPDWEAGLVAYLEARGDA